MTESWFSAYALLPSGPARDVRFEIADGFAAVDLDDHPLETWMIRHLPA